MVGLPMTRQREDVESATELFDQFIQSCMFIHDDVLDELRTENGELDWDQFGTNPFFVGAHTCVVDTLKGFGQTYLDYLNDLQCLPETIIVPAHKGSSLLDNLLHDKSALDQLKYVARQRKLDISSFYSDQAKDFERLIVYLSQDDYVPRLYPSKEEFQVLEDKITARGLLATAGVPVPEGVVCTSIDEIRSFYGYSKRRGITMLVKKHHWQTQAIDGDEDIERLLVKIEFPVIAELAYEVVCSPVSHHIMWNSQARHLFIVDQVIENWRHYGNKLPHGLSRDLVARIVEYSSGTIKRRPSYAGVCGIDYIVTPENDVFAVDLNPRFNSSTYPFYFLLKAGVQLDSICASFRFARIPVRDLSSVFTDPDFVPFKVGSPEGILLLTPVFDFANEAVIRFLYLAIATSHERLSGLERNLLNILSMHQVTLQDPKVMKNVGTSSHH